jgi:hypothetical protein
VDGELTDVDMLTASEGWAVGTRQGQPFILRRHTLGWASMPLPAFEGPASLESVYATSPNDAWAVGFQQQAGVRRALILHWDGTRWIRATIPTPPAAETALTSVAATSASDVWAIGSQCSESMCLAWVLHLAAGTWRIEPTAPGVELTSLVAFAPNDVWLFGQASSQPSALDHVEHWDGTRFTVDTDVPPATVDPHHPSSALSLAAASGDPRTRTVWAVGWVQSIEKTTHAIYRPGDLLSTGLSGSE